jgi:rsbT co-antagonist protein RsbR
MQARYWEQLFECNIDENYFQSRSKVGQIHASIGLPLSSYIAGMNFSADWWFSKFEQEKEVRALTNTMNKIFNLDIAIISSSYAKANNDLIERQGRALLEMSAPTIQLWDGILVLPILGVLDSKRAQDMTDIMLNKIQSTNARAIIVDITGVPIVDSAVANHLIKITKATRLMGCECILSGIGPEIAQTLVHLGVNLDFIESSANLKSAFLLALNKTGFQIRTVTEKQ